MAIVQNERENWVLLPNVDWQTYENLLRGRGSSYTPRFTYDRGSWRL